jgi:hypothetical protein
MSQSTPDTQNEPNEPERSNPGEGNDQTPPAAEGDTAPTETSGAGGSAATGRIDDDQLPEDLQPTDDNPLAKPLDEDADEDSGMNLGPEDPPAVG